MHAILSYQARNDREAVEVLLRAVTLEARDMDGTDAALLRSFTERERAREQAKRDLKILAWATMCLAFLALRARGFS